MNVGHVVGMLFDWSDNFYSESARSLLELAGKTQYEIGYIYAVEIKMHFINTLKNERCQHA